MEKKPYVINLKKPEDSPQQIASKLNSLKGALNIEVISDAASKSDFEKHKGDMQKLAGVVKGYEDRINYNIQNGRKVLGDDRYHGGGLSTVAHDTTLTGNGTTASPLHVVSSGSGTVTSVSVVSANGFSGTVASATSTPAITLNTTLSSGSVPFIGATGNLTQNNSNLFWNDSLTTLKLGGDIANTGDNQTRLTLGGTINDYLASAVQNKSSGDSASTDFYTSADNDNSSLVGHYTDMGIWGSGFSAAAIGQIKTISLNAGGTGYTAGDSLTIVGGDNNAFFTVSTVNGSGVILTILLTDNGTGYTSTGSGFSTTGGTGTGGKVNILSLIDNTIYAANDGYLFNSGGNLVLSTDTLNKEIIFAVAGVGATNEVGRWKATQLNVGLTGTTLGKVSFSGNTAGAIVVQSLASGSGTLTLPATTSTIAVVGGPQTFTGTQTFSQINLTANAITASGNAATVPITSGRNIVTNNSAATLMITLTTTSAVNMQTCMVQILDFSAVAQTLVFVNTENSTVTVPSTTNGSTTLPLTVGFVYNSATSKWRCVASS